MNVYALALLSSGLFATTPVPFPSNSVSTINIIEWSSADLPKIVQRSDQLPLTDKALVQLAKAKFDDETVVKMVEERRCACDASAEGLIKLKELGFSKTVIQAVSLHALAPNRALQMQVRLDFARSGNAARNGFLYFFINDGAFTRVFTVDLNTILRNGTALTQTTDQSDLLIEQQIQRAQFTGSIPLTTYGPHLMLVAASANPSLTHPSQLTEAERHRAQSYTFEYPKNSYQNICRLQVGYQRDVMLRDVWHYKGSQFECEWH